MNRGDFIRYVDMTIEEEFSIQRGMNFNVATLTKTKDMLDDMHKRKKTWQMKYM